MRGRQSAFGVLVLIRAQCAWPVLSKPLRRLESAGQGRCCQSAAARSLSRWTVSPSGSRDAPHLSAPTELGREIPGRLHRPTQLRHRIAPLVRFHQCRQRGPQTRIKVRGLLPATTGPPYPAERLLTASNSSAPLWTVISLTWDPPARPPGYRRFPRTRVSAPIINRRCRSFSCGNNAPNFTAS